MAASQVESMNPAIILLHQRLSSLITEECKQKASSFVPRPSDVFIVTPPKCGTTWTQQIVHQLRSGGDMSFEDISDVVPWINIAYDLEQDPNDEQKYKPRCFKTHSWKGTWFEGAKYITIYREPCASFYSFFKYFEGVYFQPGEITLDEVVKDFQISPARSSDKSKPRDYFEHLLTWWPRRNDPNVLFLLYEDMLEDLETTVRSIASFIGTDDEARIRNAVEMSKFDYMKKHGSKFVDSRMARYKHKRIGIPESRALNRVATGSATKGREVMGDSTKQAVREVWDETIGNQLGFKDYKELRQALRREKQS